MKRKQDITAVQKWFKRSVTYEGEPYLVDYEQAAAVVDDSLNTIVVARAGSGKTRTLVAKIIYLVARCGVLPEEIMAFVFNANAAREINGRLSKMRVDGEEVMNNVGIASTFHAFARRVVYEVCGGGRKCGKILAGEKEAYVLEVVRRMMREEDWRRKALLLMRGNIANGVTALDEEEVRKFAAMMTQFINRAQQQYLGGMVTLSEVAKDYLGRREVSEEMGEEGAREKLFVELGVECFRRYHWYLLEAKGGLSGFADYGTDFNLIVSWASKLIGARREEMVGLLSGKKYLLIDEYQDFSQLFLAAVMAIRGIASEARLFVVGDDWQAINRFAGSDVGYFKGFEKVFPREVRRLEITTNYRCDKEIVGRARKFMMRAMGERGEFKASSRRLGKVVWVNPKETICELPMVKYDNRVGGDDLIYLEMTRRMLGREPKKKTVQYVKTIVKLISINKKMEDIMLLHRNNEMNLEGMGLEALNRGLKWGLERKGVMSAEEFDAKVRVMTMHKSKGLEAEVVIILEADDGVIPKLHPDTLLYGMFGETLDVALDDQKRLFYVAMTRAKRRLYIIHDGSSGAGFVKYLGRGMERWGE